MGQLRLKVIITTLLRNLLNRFQISNYHTLETIFRRRPIIMRSVPTFLKGVFRGPLVFAMDEALAGLAALDEPRQERAWKLFMLLPRLLLHRPSRGGLVKKSKLRERFAQFASGQWDSLLEGVKELRRGPSWPDANVDGNRMSS